MKKFLLLAAASLTLAACSDLTTEEVENQSSVTRAGTVTATVSIIDYTYEKDIYCSLFGREECPVLKNFKHSVRLPQDYTWTQSNGFIHFFGSQGEELGSIADTHTHSDQMFYPVYAGDWVDTDISFLSCTGLGDNCPDLQAAKQTLREWISQLGTYRDFYGFAWNAEGTRIYAVAWTFENEEDYNNDENSTIHRYYLDLIPHTHGSSADPEPGPHGGQSQNPF